MNRKERRAAAKRGHAPAAHDAAGGPASLSVADLMAEARRNYQQDRNPQAEALCQQVLAREPAHVHALNLTGIIAQASGRHRLAVKMFAQAIASDALNAACHYNIASSYQALERRAEAAAHFNKAIALGLSDKNIEEFIVQNPVIAACLDRLENQWPLPVPSDELFGTGGLRTVAGDLLLQCAMESVVIRGRPLEMLLTHMRAALLRLAAAHPSEPLSADPDIVSCLSALAQQCFINEYVYAQSDEECQQVGRLRDELLDRLPTANRIASLTLAAVAAYGPLHSLPGAEALLNRDWPQTVAGLVRQQLHEPLEELRYRGTIPVLTPIEDSVSLQVMRQYEENPYPRWTVDPLVAAEDDADAGTAGAERRSVNEILIAGCGTGRHVFHVARKFPQTQVLAVDISRPSLAYAQRKAREAGLRNVEFAQADILKLATIGRRFDRVEAVGVLHHLADPKAGWRLLLSLLRPGGEMRVGLYSEAARRAIVQARTLIAERGYLATAEDIRKCRQEIYRDDVDGRWKTLTTSADFYSMSGCRDLLFNVMEHRFTIAEIMAFLEEQGLAFLGFDVEPAVRDRFQRQFTDPAAGNDLRQWQVFETAHPQAFRYMYVFSVCKHLQGTSPAIAPRLARGACA